MKAVKSCLRTIRLHQHVSGDDLERDAELKAQRADLDEQERAGNHHLYWHQMGSLPLDIFRVDIYTPDLEFMLHELREKRDRIRPVA